MPTIGVIVVVRDEATLLLPFLFGAGLPTTWSLE